MLPPIRSAYPDGPDPPPPKQPPNPKGNRRPAPAVSARDDDDDESVGLHSYHPSHRSEASYIPSPERGEDMMGGMYNSGHDDLYSMGEPAPPSDAGGGGLKRPPSAAPSEHFVDPPDVTISSGVAMKGELSFPKLLRVEGSFVGSLNAGGDIVVAPGGTLQSDVNNDSGYLLVEGKVIGNVSVRRVQLSQSGRIFGDITCNSFIIAPGAIVIGACQVRPEPPEKNLG